MRIKYIFESVEMGDEKILVPVGEGASGLSGVVKMNDEGLEIFNLLKDGLSEEEVVDRLSGKYSDNRDTLAQYVRSVTRKLSEAGIAE